MRRLCEKVWESGKKKSYQLCGESCQLVKLETSGEELSPFSVGSVALVNKRVDCLLCCDDLCCPNMFGCWFHTLLNPSMFHCT